jgi:hypothetical protein
MYEGALKIVFHANEAYQRDDAIHIHNVTRTTSEREWRKK